MNVELYINDKLADLEPSTVIAITKQINNFGELKDRQSTFTNSFNLPFTNTNRNILESLGLVGNTTTIQYSKVKIRLRVGGVCVVGNGFGIIKKTDHIKRKYSLAIYDGNIHFFDALGDLKLSDLDWSDLQHDLTEANFENSFTHTDANGYIYAISDYGNYKESKIEINYQLPSLFVKNIWARIFNRIGYVPNFYPESDLVITPKRGWDSVIDSTGASFNYDSPTDNLYNRSYIGSGIYMSKVKINDTQPQLNDSVYSIPNTQSYHIAFDLKLTFKMSYPDSFFIYVTDVNGNVTILAEIIPHYVSGGGGDYDERIYQVAYDNTVTFSEGDKIDFWIKHSHPDCDCTQPGEYTGCDAWECPEELVENNITFETVSSSVAVVNISTFIGEMKAKDFIKDILHHYALMVKTEGKFVKFQKAKDALKRSNAVDWSDKFVKRLSESYALSGYGQDNEFAYNYLSRDDYPFANGIMRIINETLPQHKVIITRPYNATEKSTNTLNSDTLQFTPFWEPERDDSGNITKWKVSKGKNFLAKVVTKNGTIHYGTTSGATQDYTGDYPILDFTGLQWDNLITDNYQEIKKMLDFNRVEQIEVKIDQFDFDNIDMFKLVYFKQLGAYYYINKLKWSSKKKTTIGEFIYVNL